MYFIWTSFQSQKKKKRKNDYSNRGDKVLDNSSNNNDNEWVLIALYILSANSLSKTIAQLAILG